MLDKTYLFLLQILSVFRKEFSSSEIFLNLLFITLIIIISMIFYWDSINGKIQKTSRCKRQMDLANKNNGNFVVHATDSYKQPLFDITYDINQKNTNVECACKGGQFMNNFYDIPVRNIRTNTDTKVDKSCSCDKYYNIGIMNDKIMYDGEPGIVRYNINKDTDFFDNITFSPYS